MIWSSMRIDGLSAVIGSWKIMPTRLPRSVRSVAASTWIRSIPSNSAAPRSTLMARGSRPIRLCAQSDLPEPDSPTMHRISPAGRSKLRSASA